MNKTQKEVLENQLKKEEEILKELKQQYAEAERSIEEKIKLLQADTLTQSKIYQIEYQKALKTQISAIIDNMNANNYTSIHEYLKNCYYDGFIGNMYELHKQGIPLILPVDQEMAVKAIQLDSNISEPLYTKMGKDVNELKKNIAQEVTRGLASSRPYKDIARNINNQMNIGLYKASRIARTEGHRIVQTARNDQMYAAKDKGADVVKQWDATLDGDTRPSHRRVDGEIRELDEPFSNGLMFPGDPNGKAAEVIQCRCVQLQRAKWALDEDELEELKKRAEYFGLDKTAELEEFKKKYIEASSLSAEDLAKIDKYNHEIFKWEQLAKQAEDAKNKFDVTKEYENIWQEPVTLNHYGIKKDSIEKKLDYFDLQLAKAKWKNNPADIKKFSELYDLTMEFKTKGEAYYKAYNQYAQYITKKQNAEKKIAKIINGEAPKQKVKKAVEKFKRVFTDKNKADDFFRKWADKTTYAIGDMDLQDALYCYTEGSGHMNRPLSGYDGSWDRDDFKGIGKVNWNSESKYGKRNIDFLTQLIDETEPLDTGVVLVRGSSGEGLVGLFEGAGFAYDEITEACMDGSIKKFKGTIVKNNAFTSCGVAKGTGFSGEVIYEIKCPAGTKMVYAEPQSYYGRTVNRGGNGKYYTPGMEKSGVGREAEMIIQRGTSYRIDAIEVDDNTGKINVKMTVVDQNYN